LNFENYGILYLNKNGEDYAIAGQNTNAYNVIRLGAYGGLAMTLIKSGPFYLNLGGHTGLGMLLGLANWKINTNFKKPLSFLDIGFTFRGGGELELGFKIRQITLFLAIQASYEISPLIFDVVFLSNGQNGYGIGYTDISRASARTGAKIAF
jgi:hypothetical protein